MPGCGVHPDWEPIISKNSSYRENERKNNMSYNQQDDAYRQLLIVKQSSLKVAADLVMAGKADELPKVLEMAAEITERLLARKKDPSKDLGTTAK